MTDIPTNAKLANEHHIVYGLFDPITKTLHYIGYTSNQKERYREHCNNKRGIKEKRVWIARLKKDGLKPSMEIIEEYETAAELPDAEEFWHGYFKLIGAELYNDPYHIGSGTAKGKKHTKETLEKMSEVKTGESNPFFGRHHTNETKQKLREAQLGEKGHFFGKHHPDGVKQKISERNKGKEKVSKISREEDLKETKVCGKCFIEKPNTEEYFRKKNRKRSDGTYKLNKVCIECRRSEAKDRRARERAAKGGVRRSAKLTEQNVQDIRIEYSLGEITMEKLAIKYGVTRRTIGRAINGTNWKQVK